MHSADRITAAAEPCDVVFVTELVSKVPPRPSLPFPIRLADLLLQFVAWSERSGVAPATNPREALHFGTLGR